MNLQKISWALWIVGVILILLSWTETVSKPVGWAGFGVAALGSILGWLGRRR